NMLLGSAALSAGNALGGIPTWSSARAFSPPRIFLPGPVPTKGQQTWQECEVGLIYHFDISVAAGKHTSGNNAYKEVFDPKTYNPKKLDTDQWIEAAVAAGAKYAIFTATHFNGFLQWQSNAYPYGLKQAAWK